MSKKAVASVFIAFILLVQTGCWDRKELNETGIVVALGIDSQTDTGKILLTSQVVRPGALKSQKSVSREAPYEIVVTSGDSIFEAIRNTVKEFDRRSFFSHIQVIVVSETIARKGLNDIVDFISRTHEFRKLAWIVVARGDEARNVLRIKHGVENVQASYMEGIIKRQTINHDASLSNIIEFIKKMPGEGIHPVTGVFNTIRAERASEEGGIPETGSGLSLSGTAAFKKDKLAGFLNGEETRGLNYVLGSVRSGVVRVPSLEDPGKKIIIEIKRVKSGIEPKIIENNPIFTIRVRVDGNVIEVEDSTDVSKPETIEVLNAEFKKMIEKSIDRSISKIQKGLGTDILGFGSALNAKYPKKWRMAFKDQWDTLFPETTYTLKVEAHLKQSGMLLKPLSSKGGDE